MTTSKKTLNYKDAGVDIDSGNALVNSVKKITKSTKRPEVLGDIGGFGALCELPKKYKEPILVSSTDGVGTKLRLAIDCRQHKKVGIDLVAMCVNDLLASGAEPLFFLDYFATGKLDIAVAKEVISGIGLGCKQANCALIGGETAEMPGMYHNKDYDIAGFCVGVVEKQSLLTKSKTVAGDVLIGIKSSGPHANGYSLIRKILSNNNIPLTYKLSGIELSTWLLEPTKIYVKSVLNLVTENKINAVAHITGGGITENLPRVFADDLQAVVNIKSWNLPEIFEFLQQQGNVTTNEMYRVFNCGIGMIIAVAADKQQEVLASLHENNEEALIIGHLEHKSGSKSVIYN